MESVFIFAAGMACMFWEAYALQMLWGWFVMPVFGVHAITMAQAIGLALIAGMVTHQVPPDMLDEDRLSRVIAWGIVVPAIALLVGYFAK